MTPVIDLQGIIRTYQIKGTPEGVPVLKGIDLQVESGEFVALMGASGSGKSTLLNIIGLLDRPDGGSYHLEGKDVAKEPDHKLSRIRGSRIGFIFQSFNLLAQLDVVDNVAMPLFYQGISNHERLHRAKEELTRVGLEHRLGHRPPMLSGGERQRVAIARALATRPALLVADEPTGNLDSKVGEQILGILEGLNQQGLTIVMVTHDPAVGQRAKRLVRMRDGLLAEDTRRVAVTPPSTPTVAAEIAL